MKEDLLKKYNLEEAQKRFQQICEYNYFTHGVIEADDDMQQQGNQQPPMDGDPNGGMPPGNEPQPPMDNQPPMGGGPNDGMPPADPNMGGQQPPMDDGMKQQPPMDGDPNGGMPPMDDDMNDNMGGDMPEDDMMADNIDSMQPDDEVIDVDDLTQSQEAAEYKIDGVNDKLTALMSVMPKFIEALNQNDEKLNALKAEIEKRNPTAEEQMNIRSQASYPYTETPKGYWEEKMKTNPHYDVIYNNDVSPKDEQEEFILRKDDLGDYNDQDLARSFEYPMELKDILKF